jgi:outer membrane protein TolC
MRHKSLAILLFINPVSASQLPSQVNNDLAGYSCKSLPLPSRLASSPVLPEFTFCDASGATSSSSSPQAAPTVSASSSLSELVSRNQSVESYALQVKSSEYGLKSANGSWWPNVSMSNSSILFTDILAAQNYGGRPSVPASPATAGKAFNPFNGSTTRDVFRGRSRNELTGWSDSYSNYTQAYPVIQIQWNFLNPSRYPQIAAAKKQVALSKSQLTQAQQQTKAGILTAYGEYLLAGYQIGEVLKLVSLQSQILEEANRRVNLKLLPRLQAAEEFRNLLSYQTQLQTLQVQQANSLASLEGYIRPLTSPTPAQAASGVVDLSIDDLQQTLDLAIESWKLNRDQTLERAFKHSEALKQLSLQAGIATDNANEQWGAILPTIGVLGYVTYQYTAGSQNYAPPTPPSGAASSTLSNYAGLSISWNLFDGHATRNQAKSYEQQASSYKAQFNDAATQLKTQVLQSLNQLGSTERLISMSVQDYISAGQIVDDTRHRAAVGLAESIDVLSAQMDLHQSKLQLIQALATYVKTYTQLSVMVRADQSQT